MEPADAEVRPGFDPSTEEALDFGDFRLLPLRRRLLHRGQPMRIGGRSFDLLMVLAQRPGEVLEKRTLIAQVWPDSAVEEGSLRMHVAALRKLLGPTDDGGEFIRNVPLRGYCLAVPVRKASSRADPVPTAAPPRGAAAVPPRHNLPGLLSPPIGREGTLERVLEQLATLRCLTLVGPAGIGKSLLALAAAHCMLDRSDLVVWRLDFASLADGSLAASAMATLLGIPTLAGDPLSDVLAVLGRRPAIVVLDNCEHLIESVARLAERLLAGAPALRLLCTSREPLRIAGERVLRVPALGQPPPGTPLDASAALEWPAVKLLVERAAAAVDGFVFRDDDVPAALQLCQRLDGLPLAIELVATRATRLGLRALAAQLDDHLALLTPGRRTALPRQRTLQAALDWSHGLLSGAERDVLLQLSVFRGRFDLDDARGVCAAAGLSGTAVAESVAQLAAKSLIEVVAGEPLPYRLLRTTRSHAAERLAQSGAAAAVRRRHAVVLREVLERAEGRLEGESGDAWRRAHAPRIDDLRAALDATLDDPSAAELAAGLVAAAAPLWFHLGLVRECLERVEQAERIAVGLAPDATREMRLALARGHASLHLEGAGTRSEQALTRSLALAAGLARPHDQLRALWGLFIERMMRGDHGAAREVGAQFQTVAGQLDDPQVALTSERMLALALHLSGEHVAARAHAERALQSGPATMRFLHGNAYHVDHESSTLAPLARVMWMLGHADDAADLAQLAVARAQRLDHGFSLTYALALAALPIALWRDDLDAAAAYLEELRQCTVRHSLEFWQGWSGAYASVIAWRRDPRAGALDWLEAAARVPGRADMLATFGEALVTPLALDRARSGRNAWCAAEIQRASAMRAWRNGTAAPQAVKRDLERALALARQQAAVGWERRCLASLAELG